MAYDFHQWIGYNENCNDEYFYFNYIVSDKLLENEINEIGFEVAFKEYDFKKILLNFKSNNSDDIGYFVFPYIHYLVIDVEYETSYDNYSGSYDCDSNIIIVGYLDDKFEVKYF